MAVLQRATEKPAGSIFIFNFAVADFAMAEELELMATCIIWEMVVISVSWKEFQKIDMKTVELKRKADEALDQIRAHRSRCRQATKEFQKAQEDLNESVGRLGQLTKETAGATHALSCGVPDRESNEAHYLQEL